MRNMFDYKKIGQVAFEGSFPSIPDITSLPEIAFVGRSNVGKSSAINTLLVRKKSARVSRTPGRTQLINCFALDQKIRFVDLPGYGFAKVPVKVKREWGQMIEKYLLGRETLRLVVVLVDSRHSMQTMDLQMINVLKHNNIPFLILATKADKIKRNALQRNIRNLQEGLGIQKSEIMPFSSLSKDGFDLAWQKICKSAGLGKPSRSKE
jgi:GTP-binding protein